MLGDVVVELHAASSARDTDFTANILDVFPDGKAVMLGSRNAGVVRARYRNGYDREELLTPGAVAPYRIELFGIGHTFLPGHQVRIDVSSSAYPAFSANPNTGNPIATDTAEPIVAQQKIFHDRAHASRVLLPVLPEAMFKP